MAEREVFHILGGQVDVTNYANSLQTIFDWGHAAQSRYICFCTVHMIMESYQSAEFRAILNAADFVNPDGMPLVWVLRRLGAKHAQRVTAPDITYMICERAAKEGVPVGFYGSSPQTIKALTANMKKRYPDLQVPYAFSPPFRPLTAEEDEQITREINESGARLLFMGLGCPKQERWMNSHRGKVNAVMLGVGATFDWHAGNVKRAPQFLQNMGLEWLYRVSKEPRRLWWRYLNTNPRFMALVAQQLAGRKFPR